MAEDGELERLKAEHLLCVAALRACGKAMRKAMDEGLLDHLDCCDDGGKWWYAAQDKADAALTLVRE